MSRRFLRFIVSLALLLLGAAIAAKILDAGAGFPCRLAEESLP